MKEKIILFLLLIWIAGFISSCKLNGSFVIEKRKYNNGFHLVVPFLTGITANKFSSSVKNIQTYNSSHEIQKKCFYDFPANPDKGEIFKKKLVQNYTSGKAKKKSGIIKNLVKPDNTEPSKAVAINKVINNTSEYACFKNTSNLLSFSMKNNKDNSRKIDIYAILSIIFIAAAIVAANTFLQPFAFILSLTGLTLGFISLHRIKMKKDQLNGKVMAIFSIIFGILVSLFLIGFFLLYILLYQ